MRLYKLTNNMGMRNWTLSEAGEEWAGKEEGARVLFFHSAAINVRMEIYKINSL